MKLAKIAFLSITLTVVLCLSASAQTTPGVPEIGKPAPDFALSSNEGKTVNLKDYRGKWVVLYFYPKDFTQGCTIQARNFQRDLASYDKANAVILGVSVDPVESHKNFCDKEGLNFKLLSDSGGKTSEAYGSVRDYNGNKLSARNTFIIDPQGKIAKTYVGVKVDKHSEEVLAALAEMQKK